MVDVGNENDGYVCACVMDQRRKAISIEKLVLAADHDGERP